MDLNERRRGMSRLKFVAVALAIAVAGTGSIIGQASTPAYAADYPSWSDVEAARGNETAKRAEITRIESLLAQLAQQVVEAQALEVQRGNEYEAAQQKFDEQNYRTEQYQLQADEAQVTADESKLKAGRLAAQIAKTGNDDVSASLFFDSASADDLLSQLGMASKISDSSAGIYSSARQDQNTAQSLTDQANRARDALKVLADAAEAAFQASVAASEAARVAVAAQQENKVVLDAQLAVLAQNRAATEADYNAGVAYRAEQKRIADAAAAAAAAARKPAGQISNSGWTRPGGGGFTSSYGYRVHPVTGQWAFHAGTDIQSGCGTPQYSAAAGTVIFAGPNGNWGNYVLIDNGNGVTTGYAHIANGGILVSRGARVESGQVIARTGTTGRSTGCHIHFETRIGGGTVNPVDFMRERGAPL